MSLPLRILFLAACIYLLLQVLALAPAVLSG
jgi:hypothetical protein